MICFDELFAHELAMAEIEFNIPARINLFINNIQKEHEERGNSTCLSNVTYICIQKTWLFIIADITTEINLYDVTNPGCKNLREVKALLSHSASAGGTYEF